MPTIEFHGFTEEKAKKMQKEISKRLVEHPYKGLGKAVVFSFVRTKVIDVNGMLRPFIRIYASKRKKRKKPSDFFKLRTVINLIEMCDIEEVYLKSFRAKP